MRERALTHSHSHSLSHSRPLSLIPPKRRQKNPTSPTSTTNHHRHTSQSPFLQKRDCRRAAIAPTYTAQTCICSHRTERQQHCYFHESRAYPLQSRTLQSFRSIPPAPKAQLRLATYFSNLTPASRISSASNFSWLATSPPSSLLSIQGPSRLRSSILLCRAAYCLLSQTAFTNSPFLGVVSVPPSSEYHPTE